MAASRLPETQPEKEAVHNTLEHSFGPEVDGRGLEPVEEQRLSSPQIRHTVWNRKRLLIVAVVLLCVIGAAVGGAIGGIAAKHSDGGHKSSASPTASLTSPTSPSASTSMSGLASPQLALLRYPTPISSFGQGTIDVYIRGNDDSVYTKLFINGSWQPSTTSFWSLGGIATSNVAATSRSLGLTDLLVRGNDYDIYHQTRNGPSTSWAESCQCWDRLNGSAISGPEASSSTTTSVDVFQYGGDGILYSIPFRASASPASQSSTLRPGTWNWLGLTDNLTHDWYNYTPTVISAEVDTYNFFGIRSSNRALYYRSYSDAHGWTPDFERLGGYCSSRPAAASVASGRLDVVVRGGDARLWHTSYNSYNGKGWSAFSPLGDLTVTGEPHALRISGTDKIAVFACSESDKQIWQAVFNGENWMEWTSLEGDFEAPPKAISKGPGELDVFVLGRRGELVWRNWDNDRGSWEPADKWAYLGTP